MFPPLFLCWNNSLSSAASHMFSDTSTSLLLCFFSSSTFNGRLTLRIIAMHWLWRSLFSIFLFDSVLALNLSDKNIFVFILILALTSHLNFCKICSFLFEEKKQNSQHFKNGFLNKMQLFVFSLPHLTGIKRQRHKICPLWSLPPGFSIKQLDVEDVTPSCLRKETFFSLH